MNLHADDAVGAAAHKVAMLASPYLFNALAASSPTLDAKARLEASERAFFIWAALCRAMVEWEAAAPNTSRDGYEQSARCQEFTERDRNAA